MDKYYVYLHIRLDSGEPFYVGRGKGYRAKQKHSRGHYWRNIVNKHGYDIIYLEENKTFEESNELEIYWISRIGRFDLGLGPLVNLTNGGDGTVGFKFSEETKILFSKQRKGKKFSEEVRKNMSKSRIGNTNSKGRKLSEEHKRKIGEASKGKTWKLKKERKTQIFSEETKKKMSETHKRIWKERKMEKNGF